MVDATFSQYFVSLDVLFGATSIFSLVAISLERMAAVRYATFHFNMSNKPVIVSICVTWFIGFVLFGLKIFLGNQVYLYNFTISIFLISFVMPLVVILCSYIIIFKSAHNLSKADNQTRAQSIRRDIHIAKTICIIIGLFFVCWAPFFILNLLYVTCLSCLDNSQFVLLVSIAKVMHYSNSMMNFFVYAVRSPEFRKTFRALIFHGCKTEHLRDRFRTMSMSRKRGSSVLKRNNNPEPSKSVTRDADEKTNENQSLLRVPTSNGKQNHSVTSETFLTECSDNHILYPYPI